MIPEQWSSTISNKTQSMQTPDLLIAIMKKIFTCDPICQKVILKQNDKQVNVKVI